MFQYQGQDQVDTDIPTSLEAKLFCTTFGKFVWLALQPFFYAFRPMAVKPKKPTLLEAVNVVIQLTVNFLVYYYLGKSANRNKKDNNKITKFRATVVLVLKILEQIQYLYAHLSLDLEISIPLIQ